MSVPFSFGPVVWYSVQPSRHWLPSIFAGPFRSLHLRTSKLARWLLAASAVQTTPWLSTSTPRGSKPGSGTLNTCALQDAGGLLPRCSRTRKPGYCSLTPQTESSTGLGITRVQAVADHRVELRVEGRSRAAPAPAAAGRRVALIERRAAGVGHVPRPRDLAVAVRVEHLAAPAAGLLLVLRLVVHLGVDPAEHRADQLVEVHGLVGVVVELQVMRRVARVDQRELLRLRVVVRCLAPAALQRKPVRELVRGVVAPRRILVAADLRRHPDAALAVEHRVVRIGRVVRRVRPQMLVAPMQRGPVRRREA